MPLFIPPPPSRLIFIYICLISLPNLVHVGGVQVQSCCHIGIKSISESCTPVALIHLSKSSPGLSWPSKTVIYSVRFSLFFSLIKSHIFISASSKPPNWNHSRHRVNSNDSTRSYRHESKARDSIHFFPLRESSQSLPSALVSVILYPYTPKINKQTNNSMSFIIIASRVLGKNKHTQKSI